MITTAATPRCIAIEAPTQHEALCLLGVLGAYRARLLPYEGNWKVEIDVDGELNTLLLSVFRAAEQCLDQNDVARVTFYIDGRAYPLERSA